MEILNTYNFNQDIRNDILTNQKCCLFNYSILKIINNNINIFIPEKGYSNNLKTSISFCARNDNKINLLGVKKWENEFKDIHVEKGTWVLIGGYVVNNAGHVLGDEVYAAWQALSVFNLEKNNCNIITDNNGPHIKQYNCLTKNNIYHVSHFKNKKVSFENLIIGMSRNGYAMVHNLNKRASYLPPFIETFEAFRQHTYKILDINENSDSFKNHKRNILILNKGKNSLHKCFLYEIDKIQETLKKRYQSHNVKKINWIGMNMREQVKEMAIADIIISLPGSDLMNCIFLNPKSYIICINRFNNKLEIRGSNEISIWFKYTHKCIEISNVNKIIEKNILYSKVDINILLKIIDKIILKIN
tara:strand:- start:689 stop:1765 length:1077 start_codon:yes stop_codon:yes gene_type:complete